MKKFKREYRRKMLPLRGVILSVLLLPACLLSPAILAQTAHPADVWEPLKYFVGSWEGTAKGQSGNGKVEREY